jgi:hypothetical protein
MCVYCLEASACEHERDACAASRGEKCAECGHASVVVAWHPPAFPGPGLRWSRPKPRAPRTRAPRKGPQGITRDVAPGGRRSKPRG